MEKKKPFLFEWQVFYNLGASKMCSDKETCLVYAKDIKQAEDILKNHIKTTDASAYIRSIKINSKTIL